jgi:anti-anti-sigma factor
MGGSGTKTAASTTNRVALAGEWDVDRVDELIALLGKLTGDAPATIDVRGVDYVDSTFLAVLGNLRKRFQAVPVTLLGPKPQLRRILGLMDFDRLFRIVDEE